MAAAPVFAATPRRETATVSAANTNRDGSGTIADIFTAGSGGSLVLGIDIIAVVTTTAGMIRLYFKRSGVWFPWREVPVNALTVSASQAGFFAHLDLSREPVLLPNGDGIAASTHNAEAFRATVFGGDL